MPQFDPSIFATQVFWLVLTFVPLYLILRKAVLPRMGAVLDARQRHIDSDLERASNLKEEAEAVLAEYEKALSAARAQAAAAIKQTSDEMAAMSAERHEAFGRELAEKTKAAESRIAAARTEALANVATVATEVAAAAAAKLIELEPPAAQVRSAVDAAMRGRG
ncbi:MAG: F0F1 ATP synthase subunit B' [Kiloniellaceae bacterium]